MADLGNRANVNSAIDLLLDDLQPDEAIQPSDHNVLLKDILDTLANGLSTVLRTGNTTDGENLTITSSSIFQFTNGSNGRLQSDTLTAFRNWTLPDTTGTIALLSDIPIGDSIYTADGTIGTGRVATLTDTLTFKDGTVNIQGAGTSTDSALAIYDNDTTPNKVWDFLDNGTLNGNKSKTTLIAQNNTSNNLSEYIARFRNNLDSDNYGIITNDAYFSFGASNTILNTDFSTCFQLGHFNSINTTSAYLGIIGKSNAITGSGNYRYVIGSGNTTSSGSEQVILGVDNNVSSNFGSMIGSEGVLSGTYSIAIGRAHNVTNPFCVALGSWVQSGSSGASIIGHGVEADKTQKLVNNTANSLALGWNTTTPQHLLKSDGVNLTLPTSSTGTVVGDVWSQNGTVKIGNPSANITTVASVGGLTVNADTTEMAKVLALATDITINAPTGTPNDNQSLWFRILDNGTSRTITLNAVFEDYTGNFPTSTTAGKYLIFAGKWNADEGKWNILAWKVQP